MFSSLALENQKKTRGHAAQMIREGYPRGMGCVFVVFLKSPWWPRGHQGPRQWRSGARAYEAQHAAGAATHCGATRRPTPTGRTSTTSERLTHTRTRDGQLIGYPSHDAAPTSGEHDELARGERPPHLPAQRPAAPRFSSRRDRRSHGSYVTDMASDARVSCQANRSSRVSGTPLRRV